MESGNHSRTETIVRMLRLREMKFQRKHGGDARGRHARYFFETDALAAQFRVCQLLFGRRVLAQVGNGVRVSRLLCGQQQQDQQAGQDAMQFHGLGRNRRTV